MEITPNRNAQQAAHEAEKDARDRINLAQQRAREAELQAEEELKVVKDDFNKQTAVTIDRGEQAQVVQKNKGYENLRDLKRRQDEELARVKRDGERTLNETDKYF